MLTHQFFQVLSKISIQLLGFDVFCLNKKYLVLNFVNRNLKVKYRRSFLGFFWTILSPLLMSLIFYVVFNKIIHMEKKHFLVFILSGMLPWSFFSQSISESTESIVNQHSLITRIPIPLHVFPLVNSMTHFITLIFSMPIIIGAAILSGVTLTHHIAWLLYFIPLLMLLAYSIGTILSILYAYLRDLRHAIGLLLQIWFYSTPIVYDASNVPHFLKWLLVFNPVSGIFMGIRTILIDGAAPTFFEVLSPVAWLAITLVFLKITYRNLTQNLVELL